LNYSASFQLENKDMKLRVLVAFLALGLLAGCAGTGGGLGSISKTNQLTPGMKPAEVKAVLGDPAQTEFASDKWVWKYTLHQPFKGFVPYYLVFARDSQALQGWYANEEEYMQQQQLWMQAFPATQHQKIDVRIKQ
jgi:outer membrane protein assembly factor BamE (lipoprotein component of BamABCDE complex)